LGVPHPSTPILRLLLLLVILFILTHHLLLPHSSKGSSLANSLSWLLSPRRRGLIFNRFLGLISTDLLLCGRGLGTPLSGEHIGEEHQKEESVQGQENEIHKKKKEKEE